MTIRFGQTDLQRGQSDLQLGYTAVAYQTILRIGQSDLQFARPTYSLVRAVLRLSDHPCSFTIVLRFGQTILQFGQSDLQLGRRPFCALL
ncbi:MAG: hypothetical protein U0401_01375 [Anaerolineae bacterium]